MVHGYNINTKYPEGVITCHTMRTTRVATVDIAYFVYMFDSVVIAGERGREE